MTLTITSEADTWRRDTAAGRWYGLGRYYAMFPRGFLHDVISHLTSPNDLVLDPFCGRGNAPFVATVLGRRALAVDINPIAWLYTAAKQDPAPDVDDVMARLDELAASQRPTDQRSRHRFETMAWAPQVRGLLRAARRDLQWRTSIVDRTLMAFIALHMQDKLGSGLSNSLSPTIALSPEYSVEWWTEADMARPPDVDPVAVLKDKIRRRYKYGIPAQATSEVLLGDSRTELPRQPASEATLLVTSPPYCGVTDYWNDHWLRLWLLGHQFGQDWKRTSKFSHQMAYRELITSVFRESARILRDEATILVRSDQRRRTADLCIAAIREVWPDRQLLLLPTSAALAGTSNGHGRGGTKSREIDFLLPGPGADRWARSRGFRRVEASG